MFHFGRYNYGWLVKWKNIKATSCRAEDGIIRCILISDFHNRTIALVVMVLAPQVILQLTLQIFMLMKNEQSTKSFPNLDHCIFKGSSLLKNSNNRDLFGTKTKCIELNHDISGLHNTNINE